MRTPKYEVVLTRKELKILIFALMEWRNWLIRNGFPTEDVERILIRLCR